MRSTWISAGVLTLSLAVAWTRWTAEPDKIAPDSILVMIGDASDIETINWKTEKESLSLEQRKDASGQYLWVTHTSSKGDTETSKQFKAGKNGDSLLEALSPLIAIRKLEVKDDAKRAELGLDAPTTTLEIVRKGSSRSFELGAEAYGTKDYYVYDSKGQEYFLIDDKKFNHLKRGRTTLPDRALWSEKAEKSTALKLTFGDKVLQAEHQNHQDKSSARWINKNSPEADSTQLETWIGKALRISASRYQSDEDTLEGIEENFSIELSWESGSPQAVSFAQIEDAWWAKSVHTRAWVKLNSSAIKELAADIDSLFDGTEQ